MQKLLYPPMLSCDDKLGQSLIEKKTKGTIKERTKGPGVCNYAQNPVDMQGKGKAAAEVYFKQLQREERYQRDVWL